MIRLKVKYPDGNVDQRDWNETLVTIGRSNDNNIVFPADNISGHHAQIRLDEGHYNFRDLRSTNGSMVVRGEKSYLLKNDHLEMLLEPGDSISLASFDHGIDIEATDLSMEDDEPSTELDQRTILAEAHVRASDLETSLGEDYEALRCAVRLARELGKPRTIHEIAVLTCDTYLNAFPMSDRATFLQPCGEQFRVTYTERRAQDSSQSSQTYIVTQSLLKRCLAERKGFLFMIEHNQMQVIATRIAPAEQLTDPSLEQDQIILCCPLMHEDRCYGFIQMEAPLEVEERHSLTRRDLTLATLMGHLVADHLHELDRQKEQLKLARKATAGFLAATVGHCFKNLLFVPMSLSKMLPLSISKGNMDEVEWMLARNGVNVRYLDILSNEFAAASKDPNEGFENLGIGTILREVAQIVNQIAPDKIEAVIDVDDELPDADCHGAGLKRLFMNLVLNSVDAVFNEAREDKGHIRLEAAYDKDADAIQLVVGDDGPGIVPDILENLRAIFEQARKSSDALAELQDIAERVQSTKRQGFKEHYGLGFLFVCQTVVQHHGNLEIESAPGEGTAFKFTIPRVRSEAYEPLSEQTEDEL